MKCKLWIALLYVGLLCPLLCATVLAEPVLSESYAIISDGAAYAYYYNANYEQVFPATAETNTELLLLVDESAIPKQGHYFTGEFEVDDISLGRETSQDEPVSWPVTEFTMPNHAVTIKAVEAEQEELTLTFEPGETQVLSPEAWMQLQIVEPLEADCPLIPFDDAGQYIDVNLDGKPDLQVAIDDYAYCVNLTRLPDCAAFGEFIYRFSGNMDHYGSITFTIPTPEFGPTDFYLPTADIGESAFEDDPAITTVDASQCPSVGKDAFKGCGNLTQISLPLNCDIDVHAFDDCGTVFVFAPADGTTQAFCEDIENCVFVHSTTMNVESNPVLPRYTIQFVNDDNTVLHARQVNRGLMPYYVGDTPVKAPDNNSTYAFAGWSPSLSEAVGDAVYTATYTSTTRLFTITFLDSDGKTVLETSHLTYGASPSPSIPSSVEGYTFVGWTPPLADVTDNATYTAVYRSDSSQGGEDPSVEPYVPPVSQVSIQRVMDTTDPEYTSILDWYNTFNFEDLDGLVAATIDASLETGDGSLTWDACDVWRFIGTCAGKSVTARFGFPINTKIGSYSCLMIGFYDENGSLSTRVLRGQCNDNGSHDVVLPGEVIESVGDHMFGVILIVREADFAE